MAKAMPNRNRPTEESKAKQKEEDSSIKMMTPAQLRRECARLEKENAELKDSCTCHECGRLLPRKEFYVSKKTATGVIPTCKQCLYRIATNYDEASRKTNETIDSLRAALKKADLPFTKELYESCMTANQNETANWKAGTIWQQYITLVQVLPSCSGLGWKDSDAEVLDGDQDQTEINAKIVIKAKKLFGNGFKEYEYMYLYTQYTDWISRHECKTKAQEEIFKRICFKQLEILKATRKGENTKDLDATLQNLMATGNLQPKQNSLDAFSEAQTLGTMIQKWEENRPISEPEDDLKDVDNLAWYIDVFYRGHISKVVKLKNSFSALYEKAMAKFTVKKPHYDEETDEEDLFNQIFDPKDEDKSEESDEVEQ